MQAASDAASITIARNFADAPNVRPSFRFVFLLKALNRPLPKTNSYFAYPRKKFGLRRIEACGSREQSPQAMIAPRDGISGACGSDDDGRVGEHDGDEISPWRWRSARST
jgi:hypothetical protein